MRGVLRSMAHLALNEARQLSGQITSLRSLLNSQSKDVSEALAEIRTQALEKLTQQQKQHEETIARLEQV